MVRKTGGFIKGSFAVLSSSSFLILMTVGWLIYYIFLSIWLNESFGNFVIYLKTKSFYKIFFIIFLASGYMNLLRSSRRVAREGGLTLITWIILPLGLLLYCTGFLASISSRQLEWIIVGEGHEVRPPWGVKAFTVEKVDLGLKEKVLDSDKGMGIFQYEPLLVLKDSADKRHSIGAYPPAKAGGTYFHILNFGMAPGVRLSMDGKVVEEAYMPLRIFSAGDSGDFSIPGHPYKFILTGEPEKTIIKRGLKVSQFNILDPLYSVRVFRDDKIVAEGSSKEEIRFDNYAITISAPVSWIQLEAVKDYGYPIVAAGILLTAAGLPLSFISFIIRRRRSKT